MYFNNCGIVIRPAVIFDMSYSITDARVVGKDYVEELVLQIRVPKIRDYRCSIHAASPGHPAPIPRLPAKFEELSAGEHALQFRLQETPTRKIVWRLDRSGNWIDLPEISGAYSSASAFVAPIARESVDANGNAEVRLRPFTRIEVNLFGVKGSFFLHDGE